MEYLVTMTTEVPPGTSAAAVQQMRDREATRAHRLALEGRLLRLWRPPLAPGEWRTLGLFDAPDEQQLDAVLCSMPLRVWRRDEVVPLGPHPNDPHAPYSGGPEFLTTFTVTLPPDVAPAIVDEVTAREASRARELAAAGHIVRLWA